MKEKIILKSTNKEEYGDLEIECRVIENGKIKEYLESIPEERKAVAYKDGAVIARKGVEGEEIKTTLITNIDGKTYILHEEEGTVKKNKLKVKTPEGEEIKSNDIVVTNISSTSNEQYIVKAQKFIDTYVLIDLTEQGLKYVPKYDPRVVTKIDENIIIITAWGSKAVCLKGSYIVTYNEEENDYNTIEEGAFKSTYRIVEPKNKTKKRR